MMNRSHRIAEEGQKCKGDQNEWQRGLEVDDHHQAFLCPAPEMSGDETDERTEDRANQGAGQSDGKRHLQSGDQPCYHVAPDAIGPKQMLLRPTQESRRLQPVQKILVVDGMGRQQIAEDGDCNHSNENRCRKDDDDRWALLHEAVSRIRGSRRP